MELQKLIDECHKIAVNKGWWEKQREFATVVMLVVTELSEAVQEDRKITNDDISGSDIDIAFNTRFNKTEVEIADSLIRLFDLCGAYFPDIEKTILDKMEVNKNRPYKHNRRY